MEHTDRRTARRGRQGQRTRVAIGTALVALLSGCGDGDTDPVSASDPPDVDGATLDEDAQDPAEDLAAADPDPEAPVDPPEDAAPAVGGDGFVMDGLVDSFPGSIPLPPDARIVSSYEPSWQDSGQWGVATLTEMDRDELQEFYTAAFASDGWQLNEGTNTDLFLMMEATGPAHTVNLTTADEGGLTRVDLIVRDLDG